MDLFLQQIWQEQSLVLISCWEKKIHLYSIFLDMETKKVLFLVMDKWNYKV